MTKPRIVSIDLLRGLVMLLMALDHARDFLHFDFFNGNNPLDFETTSTPLFLTRWITHFCAPVFVFLAGASAYFSGKRKTKKELSLFLLSRGLWLMLLELTVVSFGWMFSFHIVFLQVIWAIGLSMALLSVFIFLPRQVILFIGLALIFGHNLLDGFHVAENNVQGFAWSLLHEPGKFSIAETNSIFVGYPLLPWLGLMMTGYVFARLYSPTINRKRFLIITGLGCIALFVLLRSGNYYGDAQHWEQQKNGMFTFLSFINTTKYPPSLLYLLMTIGPAMLFLAFAERSGLQIPTNMQIPTGIVNAVSIFGRVPLFYYIVHIYLLHIIAGILFFAGGHTLGEINFTYDIPKAPAGFGLHLWQVYLVWLATIVLLYFPCRWYNNYNSTHSYWWLSYL